MRFVEIKQRHYCLILALWCAIIYLLAVFYKYTYFDDYTLIVSNFSFITHTGNFLRAFASDVFRLETAAYRPFLVLSLMLDAMLGGIAPWIYHMTNILIHLGSVYLLFFLLKQLNTGQGLAFVLSAFFLAHPALVPAVAWIPGRNDSLMGLFILFSLLSLLNFGARRSGGWFCLHIVSFLAALFTKETALIFPVVGFVMVMFYFGGTLGKKHKYFLFFGWGIASAGWFVLRYLTITRNADSGMVLFNGSRENLQGILGYIGKVLLPFNLSVFPLPHPEMILYGLGVILLVAFISIRWGIKNKPLFALGAVMTIMFLLPHLFGGAASANYLEHRLYVPLIGATIAFSQLNVLWRLRFYRPAIPLIVAFMLGGFAAISSLRLPLYYDHLSLWLNVIEKEPQIALSYQNLGYVFTQQGEYAKAEQYYLKAQRLEPPNKDIFHCLGVVYESQGRWQKAEDSFIRGLELGPRSSSLRYNLAYLYHQKGDTAGAERQYKLAILSRPENIMAQLNLGQLYHQQGKLGEARRQYLKVLEIDNNVAEAWYNLGIVYRQRGILDSSDLYLNHAVALKPSLKEANK